MKRRTQLPWHIFRWIDCAAISSRPLKGFGHPAVCVMVLKKMSLSHGFRLCVFIMILSLVILLTTNRVETNHPHTHTQDKTVQGNNISAAISKRCVMWWFPR